MDNLKNKKVLILGFSTTGIAAAKYFAKRGANVFLSEYTGLKEKDISMAEELKALGVELEFEGHSDKFISGCEFCILSPSIPTDAPVLAKLDKENIPYFSDIEYVSRLENEKIVLITGTNGKTTTTALTSHVLSKKYQAPYCGNIGISPIEYKASDIDYYVVEASSYQLNYTLECAPKIGIFTNLTPDHILWHKTIENYFEAKAKPFRAMNENSFAILNYDDQMTKKLGEEIQAQVYYFSLSKQDIPNCIYLENDEIIFYDEKIINVNELQIVGPHNIQNAMCAILAAKIMGLTNETIKEALKSFKAIEHRLEFIRTIDKTDYYNDSKATNPEASIVAINSFNDKKVVLIAGGRDKKTSLKDFIKVVKEKISKVILIGEATERFRSELAKNDYINIVNSKTLEEAIDIASLDKPDVVLLSPACASFDMFESYEKRGEVFRNYVLSKK
ncbi:MAG: UDP-N-acetylmuramoyl-L-alanine--D-glutamate ligase [Candidatus Gastranaerophilales bacterium]|nr:UDP-N-acetylmuramoyl-L-alanine--D-glutamate ligase [Candidatus Gastranaerophilales bacterium]